MKKAFWKQTARLLLWSHVLGVVGFYLILWLRTRPDKADRLTVQPVQPVSSSGRVELATDVEVQERVEQEEPLVSIIVPARNEEGNIRRCVQSLLEQDYERYEVIVVNDASTDATERILEDLAEHHPNGKRLWILHLRDALPEGWAGKPHALHCGVQEATGSWLLFTDADTWHAPNALRSTLAQARMEQADLFTINTTQELPTVWEKTLMPLAFMGISMLYPPRQVNDPLSPVGVANGQYILIRRTVYEQIGGYARQDLRGTLLDDRDLAYVVKQQGFKLHFVDGQDLVYVRMYHSLAALWGGWRKNAYLGNRGGLLFALVQLWGLPMISIVPFLLPWYAKLTRGQGGRGISRVEVGAATTLELTALCWYRGWLNRHMRIPWYYSLTQPLAGALFTGILGQSMWRVLTKQGVDWKGRQYYTDEQASEKDTSCYSQR